MNKSWRARTKNQREVEYEREWEGNKEMEERAGAGEHEQGRASNGSGGVVVAELWFASLIGTAQITMSALIGATGG